MSGPGAAAAADALAARPPRPSIRCARCTRRAAEHFADPRLVQWAGRYATYSGSSPYRAPATLACIPHLESRYGCWYPRRRARRPAGARSSGSPSRVGVEVRPATDVVRIDVRDGAVTGVELADGSSLASDVVVANADAEHLYRDLLPDAGALRRVRRAERSTSGFVLTVAVRGRTPGHRPPQRVVRRGSAGRVRRAGGRADGRRPDDLRLRLGGHRPVARRPTATRTGSCCSTRRPASSSTASSRAGSCSSSWRPAASTCAADRGVVDADAERHGRPLPGARRGDLRHVVERAAGRVPAPRQPGRRPRPVPRRRLQPPRRWSAAGGDERPHRGRHGGGRRACAREGGPPRSGWSCASAAGRSPCARSPGRPGGVPPVVAGHRSTAARSASSCRRATRPGASGRCWPRWSAHRASPRSSSSTTSRPTARRRSPARAGATGRRPGVRCRRDGSGKAWALQQGLEAATGEWVVLLDADTRPSPALPAALVGAGDGRRARPAQRRRALRVPDRPAALAAPGAADDARLPQRAAGRASTRGRCTGGWATGSAWPSAAARSSTPAGSGRSATTPSRTSRSCARWRRPGSPSAFLDASDLLTVRMYETRRRGVAGLGPLAVAARRRSAGRAGWPGWRSSSLAQALPLVRLAGRRADALDVVLLAVRLGTLVGTAASYRPAARGVLAVTDRRRRRRRRPGPRHRSPAARSGAAARTADPHARVGVGGQKRRPTNVIRAPVAAVRRGPSTASWTSG